MRYSHDIYKPYKENYPCATNRQLTETCQIFELNKISSDSAEIWYGGWNLAVICAYQISAKSATKKFLQKNSAFVVVFKSFI